MWSVDDGDDVVKKVAPEGEDLDEELSNDGSDERLDIPVNNGGSLKPHNPVVASVTTGKWVCYQ